MWQKKIAPVQRIAGTAINKISPKARAQRKSFMMLRHQFYKAFWEQAATAIGADFKNMGDGWFLISKDGKSTFAHREKVMLDSAVILALAGNKPLTYQLLKEDGCPIPDSQIFTLNSIEKAYKFQQHCHGDVVVKPVNAWAGNGVTVNIKTPEQLKQASIDASKFSTELLVEKHIDGDSYRLLFLNGKFIDAVRRDPPHVTGDGLHSIKKLIELENQSRTTQKPISALSPITVDADCKRTLAKQNLTLGHVPDKDEKVVIKKVVNHNNRLDNHIVRDDVHPDIIALGSDISNRYGIELSGLDILTTDISKPLEQTGGVINEINTTPGLHHHVLISEPEMAVPVGELVLEYILEHHPIIR